MPWMQTVLGMSALMALLLMVWPLMRRRVAAPARYGICVLVLIGLLVPVRPSHHALPAAPVRVELPARTEMALAEPMEAAREWAGDAPPARWSVDWMRVFMAVWLSGALAVLGAGVARHVRLLRSIRRLAMPEPDAAPGVRACRMAVSGPFAVGLLRPLLVLPEGWEADEWVIRHELVHIRRRDMLFRYLLLLVRAVHWFNPLAQLFARLAAEECELSCDECALSGADEGARRAYAGQILLAAGGAPDPLTTAWSGGKRQMKRRLSGILDANARGKGYAALAIALVLVLCAGQLFALSEQAREEFVMRGEYIVAQGASFLEVSPDGGWLDGSGKDVYIRTRGIWFSLTNTYKLKQGWMAQLIYASHAYVDANGKESLIEIALACARPEEGALPEQQEQERLRALLEEALAEAVDKDGYVDAYLVVNMDKAMGEPYRSLEYAVYSNGAPKYGDGHKMIWAVCNANDIMDLDLDALMLKTRRQALAAGAELIEDPREMTQQNGQALCYELINTYAGRHVLVRFKNGALWEGFDDAPLDTCRGLRADDETQVLLHLNCRLVALTGMDAEAAIARADAVLQRLYVAQHIGQDELEAPLMRALALEFGISRDDAQACFTLERYS